MEEIADQNGYAQPIFACSTAFEIFYDRLVLPGLGHNVTALWSLL